MVASTRGTARHSRTVGASAQAVYELLEDWGGLERWFPENYPVTIDRLEMIEPSDRLPLSRVIHTTDGDKVRETLLVTCPGTTRIYYTLGDGALPGVVGYVATNMMDPIDENSCTVTFESMFDVIDPVLGTDGARAMVQQIYTDLIGGLATYFDRNSA